MTFPSTNNVNIGDRIGYDDKRDRRDKSIDKLGEGKGEVFFFH